MSVVVVGVDGSPESIEALRFAVEEARLRGATLRIVCAWAPPSFDLTAPGTLLPEILDALQRAGEATIEDALAQVPGGEPEGVEVQRIVQEGSAARILVELAEGAAMLVLGSRGRGGFSGLLLGSTSQQCVHHATCPVTIVRAPHA